MKCVSRLSTLIAVSLFLFSSLTASAQWNKKPYTEWSEKEAVKLLSDSPWAQTQVFSETSESQTMVKRDAQGRITDTGRSDDLGSSRTSDIPVVNFRIRFLSARPVRQAFSRLIELRQKGPLTEESAARLKAFATSDSHDIVVAVLVETPKVTNTFQEARSLLYKQTTGELKNNTYLLVKGGERVYLQEYQPPPNDGLGARFIFPRTLNGKPVISPDNESVRFYCELSSAYTLNRSYKIKDMMFDGKLEY